MRLCRWLAQPLQRRDLGRRELPVGARGELGVADRADGPALQVADRVADRLEHAPDLPRAALAQGHAQPRVALLSALAGSGGDARDLARAGAAVRQGDARPQLGELRLDRLAR